MKSRARILVVLTAFGVAFAAIWALYWIVSGLWRPSPFSPAALPQALMWACVSALVAFALCPLTLGFLLRRDYAVAAFVKGVVFFGAGLSIVLLMFAITDRPPDKALLEHFADVAHLFMGFGVGWFVLVAGGLVGIVLSVLAPPSVVRTL